MSKSKDIQFLANALKMTELNVYKLKRMVEHPIIKICTESAVDDKIEISLDNELISRIYDVSINYFNEKESEIYKKMKNIL